MEQPMNACTFFWLYNQEVGTQCALNMTRWNFLLSWTQLKRLLNLTEFHENKTMDISVHKCWVKFETHHDSVCKFSENNTNPSRVTTMRKTLYNYVTFLYCSYYSTPPFFPLLFLLLCPVFCLFFLFIYIVCILLLHHHILMSFL